MGTAIGDGKDAPAIDEEEDLLAAQANQLAARGFDVFAAQSCRRHARLLYESISF
jgi:hypothetical protein